MLHQKCNQKRGLSPPALPTMSCCAALRCAVFEQAIAARYGVLLEKAGIALRGLFIINPEGIIQQITINDLVGAEKMRPGKGLMCLFDSQRKSCAERGHRWLISSMCLRAACLLVLLPPPFVCCCSPLAAASMRHCGWCRPSSSTPSMER